MYINLSKNIKIYIQLLLNTKAIYVSDTSKQSLRIQQTPTKTDSLLIYMDIRRTQNGFPTVSDGWVNQSQ